MQQNVIRNAPNDLEEEVGSGIFDCKVKTILADVAKYNIKTSECFRVNISIAHECKYHSVLGTHA